MTPRLKRLLAMAPGLLILTTVWLLTGLDAGFPLNPDFIENPDALVRLERIYQMMTDGGWFNPVLARVGPSDHLVLHWTRPLDMIVAPVAWLLSAFMPLHTAVLIGGMAVSLPLGWLALCLAARLPAFAGEHRPLLWGLCAIFLALLPYFEFVFIPAGWPDHHGLLLLVFILTLVSGHRALRTGAALDAGALGAALALGVWISPEALSFVIILQAGLGMVWVFDLNPGVARQAFRAAGAYGVALALALGLEYGSQIPGMALDRLSYFSLVTAGALIALWGAVIFFHSRRPHASAPVRAIFGLAVGAVAVAGILILAPHAVHGPMADADPWFVTVWTGTFRDGFNLNPYGGLMVCIVALGAAVVLLRRGGEARLATALLLPALFLFAVLAVASSWRWVIYSEICAAALIIAAFGHLFDRLAPREGTVWMFARTASILAMVGLAAVDGAISRYKPSRANESFADAGTASSASTDMTRQSVAKTSFFTAHAKVHIVERICNENGVVDALNAMERRHGPQLILAHANAAPALLFHTKHRVLSVPIHPDAAAVHESVGVLLSTKADIARDIKADLVVVCPVGHEHIAYDADPASLHARLSRGDSVPGLSPTPDIYGDYKIYRVER